jgi:hypothetical protein
MDRTIFHTEFNNAVQQCVKQLLEEKQLYQSLAVDVSKLKKLCSAIDHKDVNLSGNKYASKCGLVFGHHPTDAVYSLRKFFDDWLEGCSDVLWCPVTRLVLSEENLLTFTLPTVCRPCGYCKAINPPHNPVVLEPTKLDPAVSFETSTKDESVQVFVCQYQCQACKEEATIDVVRRKGLKLQLVGRSKFGRITAPSELPPSLHDLYNEATIAVGVSKLVAACAYLRLLLEKHFREHVSLPPRATGDELMDAYMELLPPELPKQKFTLRAVYGELSKCLHGDAFTAEAFESCKARIARHFAILHLFPLSEAKKRLTPVKVEA